MINIIKSLEIIGLKFSYFFNLYRSILIRDRLYTLLRRTYIPYNILLEGGSRVL